jgi:hypothetical protein
MPRVFVSIRHLPILVPLRASMEDTGDSEVGPRQPSGRIWIPDLFSGPTTDDILTMQYFGNKTLPSLIPHTWIRSTLISVASVIVAPSTR